MKNIKKDELCKKNELSKKLKIWIAAVIDLVYPRRCPVCGDILKQPKRWGYICPACRRQLSYIEPPVCLQCGKHIEDEEQEYCDDCRKHKKHFIRGYPVFVYDGALRDSVIAFKYKNRREFADFYAGEILRRHGAALRELGADGLLPVPVHRSRYRKRGYNQAELLAQALSERLGIPYYGRELYRVEKTHVQKSLNEKQRQKNLKNAFKRKRNSVKLNRVILVDDIYTTGATVEACTQVLLGTGAERVYYVSICIGQGR